MTKKKSQRKTTLVNQTNRINTSIPSFTWVKSIQKLKRKNENH